MAIQGVINKLAHCGISATQEFPGKKWGHSEEYLAMRCRGVNGVIAVLHRKISEGSERAKLQLALVTNDLTVLQEPVATDDYIVEHSA